MSGRVLIIGGTGGFGRRLAEGLIATTDLELVIGSRDRAHGQAVAASFPPERAEAVAIDTRTVTPDQLCATGGFAVVDAAGPFQGADYRLARAAIVAGMHYLDLADARDFVAGFGTLDAEARAAGVVALTGASSTPALSNAALDRMTAGWQRIHRIEIAISPGNQASPRGRAVIRSILSYAGKPVRVFADRQWVTRPGWGLPVRRDMRGVGRRWLSLCETPDLDLVPARFAPRDTALFRAGLELSVLHLGLAFAGVSVRLRLLPSLRPFAHPFRWMALRLARLGSDRGGMLVEATGIDAEGARVRAEWSLFAAAGDGPYVPTLPALAMLRQMVTGDMPAPGARACVGILDLAVIEHEFARYHIDAELVYRRIPSPFEAILGADFARLPEPVRRLHRLSEHTVAAGLADIDAASGLPAHLLCRLAGLPRSGRDVAVSVEFQVNERGGEHWERQFGRRRYAGAMRAGQGADAGLLIERFGPFHLLHRLTASPDGLAWQLVRWRLLGIPLPRWTLPAVECLESAEGERFRFDIDVSFPIIGPVIHYRGWLVPVEPSQERSGR
jgi:Domain of unknown function (DUF4166)/Saccharopine dehydrogenase NADP binding domain